MRPQALRPRDLARITVDQYESMLTQGVLSSGAPVELLDGLLMRKDRAARGEDPMTVGTLHRIAIERLQDLRPRFTRYGCRLAVQLPIRLPDWSEPEPDGAVVRGRPEEQADRHPGPDDVLAVLEVSDSSLARDRTVKARIYAVAGIRQYIVVNVADRQVEVHTEPVPSEGRYARRSIRRSRQIVAILVGAQRTLRIKASALLP